MMRIAVIGSEAEITENLIPLIESQVPGCGMRHLVGYPDGDKLERFIRASFPRILFVSMKEAKKAEYIARWIKQFAPGTQIIGFAKTCDAETLRAALRAGMLECLNLPIEESALKEVLKLAEQNLSTAPADLANKGRVISFLPSKPGVGASTIAMNVSLAIARRIQERVLLADFDLNLGLQGFMFKANEVHAATEAGDHAHHMDEEIWKNLTFQRGNLDLLGSGYAAPGQRIEANSIKELIQFWRRNYLAVCIDHSGNLERYSINLLMESDEILLISTPEIAPLHLAKSRLSLLRDYGLIDKVTFLVNRASRKDDVVKETCEQSVGLPVAQFLPNDYARLEAAIFKGTHVDTQSPLGQSFETLAEKIVPTLGKSKNATESGKSLSDMLGLSKLFSAHGAKPAKAIKSAAAQDPAEVSSRA